ncbi:efflux RND transporter periplasmic adaptor subunit [Novosphingobium sp. AP12]|uniref:efflux RND transporter periplasmic adaptor subunit n=1 Tax=Novosphingobium sp. AP12 TaxID=1144305 RepID=UPI000271F1AF|nr:efflux RND transporter periplasmic adaptor subunit [Novosphingobium sp. AP12]EJL24222.1 RND family efflux transporter, MFP subunit [Novosphingobium sp. AP12]
MNNSIGTALPKLGWALAMVLALPLGACGSEPKEAEENGHGHGSEESHTGGEGDHEDGVVNITAVQLRAAGVEIVTVGSAGAGGAVSLPATVDADPQGIRIVTAAISGRIVTLSRNLGEPIRAGETLAVLESREVALLQGEIEAATARLSLANSNLVRERRLFTEKVSPEQDLVAARTAATEAGIALRLARQQLAATGRAGSGLNRVALPSPLSGQVIARTATLGQVVTADTELYRVANLTKVTVTLSLSSADAARLRPGARVAVTAPGRSGEATIRFLSPVVDPETRLVPAIAELDNRSSQWRVGEAVSAEVSLPVIEGSVGVSVPQVAIQTVAGRPSVFVRTNTGFKSVAIEVGQASGGNVLVTRGLKGGERIAATGSFLVKAELGKGEAEHEH